MWVLFPTVTPEIICTTLQTKGMLLLRITNYRGSYRVILRKTFIDSCCFLPYPLPAILGATSLKLNKFLLCEDEAWPQILFLGTTVLREIPCILLNLNVKQILKAKFPTCSLWAHYCSKHFLGQHSSILREGNGTPTPVLLPGKSHGRRSLVGCSPWGREESVHDWVTSLSLFTFMRWRRKWQPTPVFLPGESQGWGSLVGCRLWGRTESDTTEAT